MRKLNFILLILTRLLNSCDQTQTSSEKISSEPVTSQDQEGKIKSRNDSEPDHTISRSFFNRGTATEEKKVELVLISLQLTKESKDSLQNLAIDQIISLNLTKQVRERVSGSIMSAQLTEIDLQGLKFEIDKDIAEIKMEKNKLLVRAKNTGRATLRIHLNKLMVEQAIEVN